MTLFNIQASGTDKTTVQQFDIDRYLGTWYEIARYDHPFEKNLIGVKAQYEWAKRGKITVINSGYNSSLNNKYQEAIGKAKIPNMNTPAKLKVSFFLFFYADYYVFELDEDYNWAIVGGKSDKYLWILSRTPTITAELYNSLLHKIKIRGYDTSSLIQVRPINTK